jgi:hypothetical protein
MKDLRTEQYRLIYDRPIYPKNLCLEEPPRRHEQNDAIVRAQIESMIDRDIFRRASAKKGEGKERPAEKVLAD